MRLTNLFKEFIFVVINGLVSQCLTEFILFMTIKINKILMKLILSWQSTCRFKNKTIDKFASCVCGKFLTLCDALIYDLHFKI